MPLPPDSPKKGKAVAHRCRLIEQSRNKAQTLIKETKKKTLTNANINTKINVSSSTAKVDTSTTTLRAFDQDSKAKVDSML